MIKQKTILEVAKSERVYQLEVQPDSPLGEIYDVLNQMRQYVVSRIEAENKQQEEAMKKAKDEADALEKKEDAVIPEVEEAAAEV